MPAAEPGSISSAKNPAVVAAARLHRSRHRRIEGETLVEGPQVVAEAIGSGAAIRRLFGLDEPESHALAAAAGIALTGVTRSVLSRIAGTDSPRGPVAVVAIPDPVIATDRPLLITWGVSDPGNCGTLVRSAAAFGYGYASGPGSADVWSPKVVRSAAGGHFRAPIGVVDDLDAVSGFRLVGTVVDGGLEPGALRPGDALLVGSEAHGLPPEVTERCDRLVTIPMPGGAESLNAAVAGSIIAYLGALPGAD
jgi:TrmH family RNA methyltransferase